MASSNAFSLSVTGALDDAVLLNRAIYGGSDDMLPAYLNDYDAARDPDAVGNRAALNVYDRYDLYLKQFGFTTLSASELGFAPADISASEMTDGLDKNFTYIGDLYRNNYEQMDNGTLVPFTNAGAVALVAVKDTAAGKTLELVLRGTDADLGADGEAGTGPGQVRYYRQLLPLIDKVLAYISDPSHGITDVVVSGHSLGGAMADMFALYDGAAFAAVPGVKLQVIALASAGIDPDTLTLKTDYDHSLVTTGPDGTTFNTPSWYAQYDHSQDIVRNPETYDADRHAQTDPSQAPVTAAAETALMGQIHFSGHRVQMEAPLVDQYEISKNFQTNFLSQHYADFYELTASGFASAAKYADNLDYDHFIALFGVNERLVGTLTDNNVNAWGVPVDNAVSYASETSDLFILGLSGKDRIVAGDGSDLLAGGSGDDVLEGGGGADILIGGSGVDTLRYDTAAHGVSAYLSSHPGVHGDAAGDRVIGIENLSGSSFDDHLYGTSGANALAGRAGGDDIYGLKGSDELNGGTGADELFGGSGKDVIEGRSGDDRLRGSTGDDVIAGGHDRDDLWGGSGHDLFVFKNSGGRDHIHDFNNGGDRFDMHGQSGAAGFDDLDISKVSSGVLVDYGTGSFVIEDIKIGKIGASDFIFDV